MVKKEIGVAVIGNGQRGKYVVNQLLKDSERNVHIVSVFDPDKECSKDVLEFWGYPEAKICSSCEEAIKTPGVEWVMVFSPNVYHKEGILTAFAEGKHVFSEKPLATSIQDCQEIYKAHQKTNLLFATGFVLRYAPIYRRVREIIDSGILGKLISVEANENILPEHGGYIMCNWRRHTSEAGPHILEKCCHDIDLLLWFIGSLPEKVASFGGTNMFTKENSGLMEKYGKKRFCTWPDPHAIETPFSGDTDLMDNTVSIAEFRNGVRLSFCASMCNIIPERRMRFNFTEGNLIIDLYTGLIHYRQLGSDELKVINVSGDGHGGGDSYIMKELYESMCTGSAPKCSGNEGLESAVFAIAMDEAAKTQQTVDMKPIWESLGR